MTRLAALVLAFLAVFLAAVAYVLRPKWRWEEPKRAGPIGAAEAAEWMAAWQRRYSTSSPYSVTSRADNGTGFDPRLMGA
ncbi:MAG: hypothetical protein C0498_01420 [Anaerolinea sp.]|nr:hypothetical protein [Anaerolinea sp.]